MRFRSSRDENEDFQMAPMIDMVFLLLVFFMVVSNLSQLEKGLELDLPESGCSEVSEEFSDRCIVSLGSNSPDEYSIYLGKRNVSIEEFVDLLAQYKKENPSLCVQLRASRYCAYEGIDEVLKCCAELGVLKIIYSTIES